MYVISAISIIAILCAAALWRSLEPKRYKKASIQHVVLREDQVITISGMFTKLTCSGKSNDMFVLLDEDESPVIWSKFCEVGGREKYVFIVSPKNGDIPILFDLPNKYITLYIDKGDDIDLTFEADSSNMWIVVQPGKTIRTFILRALAVVSMLVGVSLVFMAVYVNFHPW